MKNYLFALFLVTFTTVSMAQDIKYGVRGGINISNLDFEPDADFENKHRNGFAFGGFADLALSEKVSLQVELEWSAEGGKDEELRADYIHLPLFLKFSFSDRLSVLLGPKVGLKTWGYEDGFSTFIFSGTAGLEYMFIDELFFDVRLTNGFTDILDDDSGRLEAKNHVIQFGFGIKI